MSTNLLATLVFAFTILPGFVLLRLRQYVDAVARLRNDHLARQSSHVGNPLRLGGLAVLTGLALGIAIKEISGAGTFAPFLLLSALPVLVAGLAEDLGHHVSPRRRFVAAIFSALAAVALLGAWVPRADLPGIDWAMTAPIIAIVMTITFSAIFCHAVNLIDGMNGLAASVLATSALGCAAIAFMTSQTEIMALALLLAVATIGFLLLNWPVARLFLGDAGAYGLGHLLVWLLFLLAWRESDVAIPALILIAFWPVADVLHTVARRAARKAGVFHPDRMHLHQKIRRLLDIVWFGYRGRWRSNPLTTLILFPFIAAPVIAGVVLWDKPLAAWGTLAACLLIFSAAHPLTTHLALRYRR